MFYDSMTFLNFWKKLSLNMSSDKPSPVEFLPGRGPWVFWIFGVRWHCKSSLSLNNSLVGPNTEQGSSWRWFFCKSWNHVHYIKKNTIYIYMNIYIHIYIHIYIYIFVFCDFTRIQYNSQFGAQNWKKMEFVFDFFLHSWKKQLNQIKHNKNWTKKVPRWIVIVLNLKLEATMRYEEFYPMILHCVRLWHDQCAKYNFCCLMRTSPNHWIKFPT